MTKLPLALRIQGVGEITFLAHNGFYVADIPYKYQGNMPPRVSMNADDNIDNSVKYLQLIFENIEFFIEEARKIVADDCGIDYSEALKTIPLYTVYVSHKGDYQIEFIHISHCTQDCTAIAAVFGDIETGHNKHRPAYYA